MLNDYHATTVAYYSFDYVIVKVFASLTFFWFLLRVGLRAVLEEEELPIAKTVVYFCP